MGKMVGEERREREGGRGDMDVRTTAKQPK